MEFFDIFIALLIGLGVGIVLQRGRVCTNTIFRNLTLFKNGELFTIIVIAVTIEMIGYQILAILPNSTFQSNPISLSWLFLPIGSIIFGFGTVIAGGCAGGVCYRVGEGNSKSLLALLGFGIGIAVLNVGPLSEVFFDLNSKTDINYNNTIPTLEILAPRWVWTVITIIIAIGFIYYYMSLKKKNNLKLNHLLPNWTPIISGLIIGALGVVAKYHRNFSLSTVDGIGNIAESLLTLQVFNWAGFFIIGLILGSFISSVLIKEFKINKPNKNEVFQFLGGGFILGFGAMLALGCNFGHIFGGIPELGISSLIALPLMVLGNWIGSHYYYIRLNNPIPKSSPQ